MDRKQQYEVYQAQTTNLRVLEQCWEHTKRGIHRDLLENNKPSAALQTKFLALVYCAWSETAFSKLIHTPYGFALNEIRQIKAAANNNGIVFGWKKCVALALRKVKSRGGNYIPNINQELNRLVEIYIEKPSQLRNKVAHGQWEIALNSKNTSQNPDLTAALSDLDLVKIELLKEGCVGLCRIINDLVASPEKAFHRDYWKFICDIRESLDKSSRYTLASKIALLQRKRSYTRKIYCDCHGAASLPEPT